MYSNIVKFIHDLYKTEEFVPLHAPCFVGNEKKYLNECIDSTFVSSVGKFVDRFEEDMARYCGAKKAVVCVNGTNAVFLDVDRTTMGLSPQAVKEWLGKNSEIRGNSCYNKNTGRRIKACIPMHTFGHPVKIDELAEICRKNYIELVEDAAESIGSLYKGQHTGTFGRIGAISFNGNKTITTGGGGMMLFQDEELGKLAKYLTTQAKVPHRWEFVHDRIGYNYRMPNINAALGCAQLENLDRFVQNKRETAALYKDFFSSIPEIEFWEEPENCYSNYWLNVVLLKDKAAQQRFLEYTNDHGIMTRPVWELMNKLPMFCHYETDKLTNTQWFAERVVNIPSSVRL